MDTASPAEKALQLLFKKLHPLLEDAAHALSVGAQPSELLKGHEKLQRARAQASEVLEALGGETEIPELADLLDNLAANLTPLGEPFQQSLVLTQLCLEEAPKELLSFVPQGRVAESSWGKRMVTFLARLEAPEFQARQRWASVDPDLGDDVEELS